MFKNEYETLKSTEILEWKNIAPEINDMGQISFT